MKNVFFTTLIVLLSTTVTINILKNVRVSLKLSPSSQIYKQPSDRLNLMDIMSLIRKNGFKDLDFFILDGDTIGKIAKTIILMDKIDNII